MAEMKLEHMDADAFLDWCTSQEDAYELVDGLPRMMSGARARHDEIVVSALAALRAALRGRPCRPYTGDLAVRAPNGNIRRPDVTVDCATGDPDRLAAAEPVLLIEVFSPSTRHSDLVRKLAEYQAITSVRHILMVEPQEPIVLLHSRSEDGSWSLATYMGLATEIPLSALDITLLLSDFYE